MNTLSYSDFLDELNLLLHSSGILPSRTPIRAEANENAAQNPKPEEVSEPEIGKILLYMDEHLSEDLRLEDLAAFIQLSKYQLIRRFREEMDSTPWQYLIQRRLDKSKELLEAGVPPSQAAVEAGFYDQSHLNRVFKEHLDTTPKNYQEENFKNRN